jgi:hypothetical protein
MQIEGRDINIIFKPQVGLGNILFSFQEREIINVLGIPDKKEIDNLTDTGYAIYLYYNQQGISPSIYYENEAFESLHISTDDLILNNVKFSTLTKDEIVKCIEDYHCKNKLQYLCKYIYEKEVNEDYYYFKNIGLTIWFEGDLISDICVQKSI